ASGLAQTVLKRLGFIESFLKCNQTARPGVVHSEGMLKIAVVYIDSGGGHRAAANALCEVIRQQQRPWKIELLSIQDMLDSIDFIRKYTGVPFQDIYNIMLRRGWTYGSAQMIPLMHFIIRIFHRSQVRVLKRHWSEHRPDL